MDKIQLIFFFISGFFISRLLIKTKLPEFLVHLLIGNKTLSLRKLILSLIFLSAIISFFIPNVITVLALLPLINLLSNKIKLNYPELNIATIFALAVMYGANVGGMGSITATPANGILVGFLTLKGIDTGTSITFSGWLLWGIPLVIVFCLLAWGIIMLSFRIHRFKNKIKYEDESYNKDEFKISIPLWITGVYFFESIVLSWWMINSPNDDFLILSITALFTVILLVVLFLIPIKFRNQSNRDSLLKISDCYSNLPLKGFLFVGISILVAVILVALNIDDFISEILITSLEFSISDYLFLLLIALAVSFTTEILSNTAIQLSMFIVLTAGFIIPNISIVSILLVVTLSSTCAFMSPIATGVNGLAFGGIKGVSLKQMMLSGFFMNIFSAVLITFWVIYVTSI